MPELDYADKVAVITGGARGFGKAFGQALAERGATVVLIDRDGDAVREATSEIGVGAVPFHGDVTDEPAMAAIMTQAAELRGGIDILINNAGLHSHEYSRPIRELGLAKVKQLFDVNVIGVVTVTLAAHPFMSGRDGANIINIASASAFLPGGYGTSKLAAIGLTLTFAREFSEDRIRVNAIAPGVILTDTIKDTLPVATIDRIKGMQFMDRHGAEDDIVQAMLFLTSNRASFITGETLRVTGGFTAGI